MHDASLPHRRLSALSRRHPGRTLVVLVPDVLAAESVREVLYGNGEAMVGLDPAPVLDVARRIGRIHPQAQGKTALAPETARELIRESLEAMDASTRASLQGSGTLDAVVRRVAEVVHLLRANDVAPASLYALTSGSAVRPNRRAVAVGFEAVQRHLLAASDYDAADVLGWATAQVRSGRAPHVRATVYAAFDGVELSEREAAFVRALRDEAEGFYRLGSASTPQEPPPASVAARFSGAPVVSMTETPDVSEESVSDDEPSAANVYLLRVNGTADEQIAAARECVDRKGVPHDDVEILAPSALCRQATTSSPLSPRRYARAGFGACRHRVVVLSQPDAPSAPAPLLSDDDRDTLAGLTGAVLPRAADDERREAWHLTQAMWRVAGAAGVEALSAARRDASDGAETPSVEAGRETPPLDVPAVNRSAYEDALGDLVATLARLHAIRDDRERVHTEAFVRSVLHQHGGAATDATVEALQGDLRAFASGEAEAWIEAADRLAVAVPTAWHEPEPAWTVVDLALRVNGTWRLVLVRRDTADSDVGPDPLSSASLAKAVARAWSRATNEPVEAGFWQANRAAWEAVASADAAASSSATEPIA